jgi:hypothetical protein
MCTNLFAKKFAAANTAADPTKNEMTIGTAHKGFRWIDSILALKATARKAGI